MKFRIVKYIIKIFRLELLQNKNEKIIFESQFYKNKFIKNKNFNHLKYKDDSISN